MAGRDLEYLYRLPGGRVVHVSSARHHRTFRLFLGKPPVLMAVPVFAAMRYRDGGSTVVRGLAGALHHPTPFGTDPAAWRGWFRRVEAEALDPAGFEITENRWRAFIRETR